MFLFKNLLFPNLSQPVLSISALLIQVENLSSKILTGETTLQHLLLFLLLTMCIQVSGLTKLHSIFLAFVVDNTRSVSERHFFSNACQTFHIKLKAQIIWYSALANAVTIVFYIFYVEADILFIKWTPSEMGRGVGNRLSCFWSCQTTKNNQTHTASSWPSSGVIS